MLHSCFGTSIPELGQVALLRKSYGHGETRGELIRVTAHIARWIDWYGTGDNLSATTTRTERH